jgi:hypothetical protein
MVGTACEQAEAELERSVAGERAVREQENALGRLKRSARSASAAAAWSARALMEIECCADMPSLSTSSMVDQR